MFKCYFPIAKERRYYSLLVAPGPQRSHSVPGEADSPETID